LECVCVCARACVRARARARACACWVRACAKRHQLNRGVCMIWVIHIPIACTWTQFIPIHYLLHRSDFNSFQIQCLFAKIYYNSSQIVNRIDSLTVLVHLCSASTRLIKQSYCDRDRELFPLTIGCSRSESVS